MNANMESFAGVRDKVFDATARTAGIARQAGSVVSAHAGKVARNLSSRLRDMEPTARALGVRVMKASGARASSVDRMLGLTRRVISWTAKAARSAVNELQAAFAGAGVKVLIARLGKQMRRVD